jgi:pilus assembly protein CpaE
MNNPRNPIHLLAALSELNRFQVQNEVSSEKQFVFNWVKAEAAVIFESLASEHVDFLLLEFTDDAEGIIDRITLEHPNIGVVMLLPEEDYASASKLMLAGARAFIPSPVEAAEFTRTFSRLAELQQRSRSAAPVDKREKRFSKNRAVTVFSPRGGSGTTTLAINLSIAMKALSDDQPVILIDSKSMFGHVDLMLNLKTENSIADLVPHINDLDSRIIEDVVVSHLSGIDVLPAPNSLNLAQSILAEHIFNTSLYLRNMYHVTVIDGGSRLDETTVTWMDTCERIILVVTPDLASLRDAQIFLEESKTLAFPTEKVLVILNKDGARGGIPTSEIEKALERDIFATIPFDDVRVARAINRGVPPIVEDAKSKLSKSIHELANALYADLKNATPVYSNDDDERQKLLDDAAG